jgi:hypothetical protein
MPGKPAAKQIISGLAAHLAAHLDSLPPHEKRIRLDASRVTF